MGRLGSRTLLAVATAIGTICTGACAPHGIISKANTTPIEVSVTNEDNFDADVYALGASGRYHLGFVPTNVTAGLYVPSYIVSSGRLRLLVRRIGANTYHTPSVAVNPGDSTTVVLQSDPGLSTFVVNPR